MPSRYDLQVHTDASPCSATPPSRVVEAAVAAGLDGIVITDHDTTVNVEAAQSHAPAAFDVVSGAEITTTEGHLLAIGVEFLPVDPPVDPLQAIDAIHDAGGYAVLSHPFDTLRQYYKTDLDALGRATDAVEGINSRCVLRRCNRRAQTFATEHGLPVTGGSDAHFAMEIGRATTVTDGSLLTALKSGTVRPEGRGGYLSGHIATKLHQARTAVRG